MRSPLTNFLPSWLLAAGLLALLLILASLQYRWLEEVSRADRDKSRDLLQAAVTRFAEDFDRELTRTFLFFQPRTMAPASQRGDGSWDLAGFAGRYRRWQTYAPYPELVRDVFMATPGDDTLDSSRFDPSQGAFVPAPWPAELEELRQRMAAQRRWPRRRGEPRDGPMGFRFLADEIPALILPISGGGPFGGGPAGVGAPGEPNRPHRLRPDDRPRRRGGPPTLGGPGFIVVRLDLDTIRDVILPRLSERHLHGGDAEGTEYQARVFALRDQRLIFRRGVPPDSDASSAGDAGAGLFSLLPPEKLGTLELEAGLEHPEAEPDPDRPPGRRLREGLLYRRLYGFISAEDSSRWRLEASHPAGSLDAAVARAHRRNLAISFGILLLLGASLLLMLLTTRRLQALARQQLEFVAGVTHELLTPLAAMRSAGQNLADGVVAEPRQVRRYGRLVEDEGRRLSTMVEQVLEFAGIQAGGRSYALERIQLATVVDSALAEYQALLDERGVRLEKSLDEDLPDVMADARALRRAVQNLIANALKYGTDGPSGDVAFATLRVDAWIGLRAAVAPGGKELEFSVEDRGPGIEAADLPRLFEPFYRGRGGASDAVPGSGLGLSLVKHVVEGHGGRVTVHSRVGAGSTFTIHLPAVAGDRPGSDSSARDRSARDSGRSDEL